MHDRVHIVFFAAIAALVVFSLSVATALLIREGLGTNGAAWVQAGGSIAAIAGAIWLFRSETIRRKIEKRAAGEELAWAVRYAIRQAQLEVGIIVGELLTQGPKKDGEQLRDLLLRTTNCQDVLRVYVERLDHLHPSLNFHANNAILLLRQLEEELKKILTHDRKVRGLTTEESKRLANFQGSFGHLLEELDARMRGVLRELDKSPNVSPAARLKEWKPPEDR